MFQTINRQCVTRIFLAMNWKPPNVETAPMCKLIRHQSLKPILSNRTWHLIPEVKLRLGYTGKIAGYYERITTNPSTLCEVDLLSDVEVYGQSHTNPSTAAAHLPWGSSGRQSAYRVCNRIPRNDRHVCRWNSLVFAALIPADGSPSAW